MSLPKFYPPAPDVRFFERRHPARIRNVSRTGMWWTPAEEEFLKQCAAAGVDVAECGERMGRPWSAVATRYISEGVLFMDNRYRLWQRRTVALEPLDEPI